MRKKECQLKKYEHFALYNRMGYWLARLSGAMHHDFILWVSKYDITGPQWLVMNALYFNNAHSGSSLAEYIGVDKAAITRVIDQLEAKQFIERVVDVNDRRSQKINLMAAGVKTLEKIFDEGHRKQEKYTDVLSEEEKRAFQSALLKMLVASGIKTIDDYEKILKTVF